MRKYGIHTFWRTIGGHPVEKNGAKFDPNRHRDPPIAHENYVRWAKGEALERGRDREDSNAE